MAGSSSCQCSTTLHGARGWIRRNTKIGPVFNIHVCHHEDRYSIEIEVQYLFQDRTASWVRIVSGVEKYVTETTETIEDEEHRALGKPIAKARPRMKSPITLTPVSVPLHERKWMDINPDHYDHKCYVVSKAMIRLLRRDQTIPRETDGAVKFDDLIEEFKKKKRFDGALQWKIEDWISILARGGGQMTTFQYCLNPNSSRHILYFRAIQGKVILVLLLLILSCKTMYWYQKDLLSASTTSGM